MIRLEEDADLRELRDSLKELIEDHPHVLRIYGIAASLLRDQAREEIFVDQWPEYNLIIARPSDDDEQHPEMPAGLLSSSSIFCKSPHTLPDIINLDDEFQFDKACSFAGLQPAVADVIDKHVRLRGKTDRWLEADILVARDNIKERPLQDVPGFMTRIVTAEMVDEINSNLAKGDDVTRSLIAYNVSNFSSVCSVPMLSPDHPAAYILQNYVGSLGMLNVRPAYRAKGLAKCAIETLAHNLLERGEPAVWTNVEVEQRKIRALFEACGFTAADRAVWLNFTPSKKV